MVKTRYAVCVDHRQFPLGTLMQFADHLPLPSGFVWAEGQDAAIWPEYAACINASHLPDLCEWSTKMRPLTKWERFKRFFVRLKMMRLVLSRLLPKVHHGPRVWPWWGLFSLRLIRTTNSYFTDWILKEEGRYEGLRLWLYTRAGGRYIEIYYMTKGKKLTLQERAEQNFKHLPKKDRNYGY